jgi:hypothetical protein
LHEIIVDTKIDKYNMLIALKLEFSFITEY